MGKILVVISTLLLTNFLFASQINAQELAAGSSAILYKPTVNELSDSRARILREFLKQYDSPLAPFAEKFVKTADKYYLDWKLVAAISGLESTFGREIPYESYNGWGWGIFGNNTLRFKSWEEGIETVSEGLRNKYINQWKAKNIYEIGRIYASSPTWAQRVEYFMNKINQFAQAPSNLSISL